MLKPAAPLALVALHAALLAGCASRQPSMLADDPPPLGTLEVFATSDTHQWTGVAVSRSGRVFVNYPRWHEPMNFSVAELRPGQPPAPVPDEAWQRWSPQEPDTAPSRWVCVQSVHVDALDRLWILDTGSPQLAGVVPGGAKLARVNIATNAIERVYPFAPDVAPTQSYLNDVRIDTRTDTAYLTDSGLGAIIVLDLRTGNARRLLADHPSTKAVPGFVPVIEGRELRFADGSVPQIHSDGLALSPDGVWLYYQPITGKTLHRVPTAALRDASLTPDALAARVESLGETVVTDGMEMDEHGNLYFSTLELDAVVVRRPDGSLITLAQDSRLAWPDSFALAPDGTIAVSTAQIHRSPWFHNGKFAGARDLPAEPYLLLRLRRPGP